MKRYSLLMTAPRVVYSIVRQRLAFPLLAFAGGLMLAQPCAATPFEWGFTGSLRHARALHTATLLTNGEVLVAAGVAPGENLRSVELYNPSSGDWSLIDPLHVPRFRHTATLLSDGRVLIAGGDDGAFGIDTAELYDPASGTWALTDSLNTARWSHTATLLTDGKILVATGEKFPEGLLASAELYDAATGTWTFTGSLNTARIQHTATLLPDGRVLVVGGNSSGGPLASAELYDPVTGTWTLTGSLNQGRTSHTATLLPNGKVLVAGGAGDDGSPIARTELYDPATGIWTLTGLLHTPREQHTATLLASGKVLVVGGFRDPFIGHGANLASAELYDPATGRWTVTGSLNTGRRLHTATLLPSDQVLVAAGFGDPFSGSFVGTVELYDPGITVPATIDGHGAIDNSGNQVTFDFHASQGDDGNTLGSFSFCDPAARICITDAKFHSLSVEGNTAYFVGSALAEHRGRVIFNVSATDNGEPGTSDSISITLGNGYSASSTLVSGDIRIQ